MIIILIFIIFFVALDRFLKVLAYNAYFSEPINLLGNILRFAFASNYKVALSIPLKGSWVILLNSIIVIALLYYLLKSLIANKIFLSSSLALVVFGAVSNILDRIKFGYVIDYLDLRYFSVFNLADVMIVVGISILLLINLKKSDKSG